MNDISIRIENVSKQYRLDMVREKYYTIRDYLTDVIKAPIRNFRRLSGKTISEKEIFWALKDINLEIKKGDVLGIIGRNGAGKSTLLKVISRITPPTTGRIEIYGRVGSLLEVGTGFHPELTGRENIYLNGSVLGMKKCEVDKKFDAIVQFAEIEKFLDTPVKRYSSGMYVRLAFAVAAHMETEILLVDEVLAVGDINFQKKCLGKMGEVSKEGRTVLFVSHNMSVVNNLCEKALWIDRGKVMDSGPSKQIVKKYLDTLPMINSKTDIIKMLAQLPHDPVLEIKNIRLYQDGQSFTRVNNDRPFQVEIDYQASEITRGLRILFDLCDENLVLLIRSIHDDSNDAITITPPGLYRSTVTFPGNVLAPRRYILQIHGLIHNTRLCTGPGISIFIDVEHTSPVNRAYPSDSIQSKLLIPMQWETIRLDGGQSVTASDL